MKPEKADEKDKQLAEANKEIKLLQKSLIKRDRKISDLAYMVTSATETVYELNALIMKADGVIQKKKKEIERLKKIIKNISPFVPKGWDNPIDDKAWGRYSPEDTCGLKPPKIK